jgi:hypothetical protein
MREDLVAFYEDLREADPACAYVTPILARLRTSK